MIRLLIFADKAFRWLLVVACSALLVAMLLGVGAQVLMRYVFNQPLLWSEELARYCMVWLAMLAAGLAAREGQHIALGDLFPFPRRVKLIVSAVTTVVVAVTLWILIEQGWAMTERTARQLSPALRLKMSWVYAAIPVGAAMMVAGLVLGWLREACSTRSDESGRAEG